MNARESQRLTYDLSLSEWEDLLLAWGEPRYRARQIWDGLYLHFWQTPEQFTNLPVALRERLREALTWQGLTPGFTLTSKNKETTKTLFNLVDRSAIEAVWMRYSSRNTLCISSQAGCAMGCVFCATGQMGFRRNLSSGEIIEQVIYYSRLLKTLEEKVTNIVVMGMGEPFHNYEATLAALDRLNMPQGYNLGTRRFTISTVGLVPAIRRFTAEKRQYNLAISLHAADDELRSGLLPINKKYPLDELFSALREYATAMKRRITFEWALIQDVNDGNDQALKLAQILKGILCHVNLIPLNPTSGYTISGASQQRAISFQTELERRGIPCTIRLGRGIDIEAGCGQLAIKQ